MKQKYCCKKLAKNFGLVLDDQDIRDYHNGCCPYCGSTDPFRTGQKSFLVEVIREAWQSATFEIRAPNKKVAMDLAMDKACDVVFTSEDGADYKVGEIVEGRK